MASLELDDLAQEAALAVLEGRDPRRAVRRARWRARHAPLAEADLFRPGEPETPAPFVGATVPRPIASLPRPASKAQRRRDRRDRVIRAAVAGGASQREVSEALGLSRIQVQRVLGVAKFKVFGRDRYKGA